MNKLTPEAVSLCWGKYNLPAKRSLSVCQMAHLFLFVCSASEIQNVSLMYLLRTTHANLMNRLSCTQAGRDINDVARNRESKLTSPTHDPDYQQQTPCKEESRQRQKQDTSELNTPKHVCTVPPSAHSQTTLGSEQGSCFEPFLWE